MKNIKENAPDNDFEDFLVVVKDTVIYFVVVIDYLIRQISKQY